MANVVADRPVAELCGQESEELLFTCALSVVDDLLLRDMYPLPGYTGVTVSPCSFSQRRLQPFKSISFYRNLHDESSFH
ncbi:hypothetical protein V6N12_035375 [Hibiscus sabdariffa]|uniref:Uncharacterized protein n=1 Tax=Hibiscus sabdariffa TaxID=183260 RepID=A0ABR2BU61_9ROSI